MKRAKLNLIIDVCLLWCIAAIAGIGLLVKYVLVPGFKRWEIYGRNVDLFFWGLDRHGWGTIHLAIGLAFLALLILHILLHWKMVTGIYCKLLTARSARWLLAAVIILLTLLLLVFPAFVEPDVQDQSRGASRHWQKQQARP